MELTSNTESIGELFAREPDSWTDADMERMIVHLRKLRLELDAKPEKKASAKVPKEDVSGLSVDDLQAKLGLNL